MVTAFPALTVSALYVFWDACRRERRRREQLQRQDSSPADEPGRDDLHRRLTILTYHKGR